MNQLARDLGEKLLLGGRLWLFLDYDGTLAEFAPTPDTILPDEQLIALFTRLAQHQDILRVVIMSGRRFSHIESLLPVPGILIAGTYGIEFKTWQGQLVRLLDFATARPFLDQVKKAWLEIIQDQDGFYLEDKGYSLAIHARFAEAEAAENLLPAARRLVRDILQQDIFRILNGYRFIEVAPLVADKGQSVSMLLRRFPWPGADVVYIGDDDKDEEAFRVVQPGGGISILVAREPRETTAQYRLETPSALRAWLGILADTLDEPVSIEPV
jgi:trehalose 6-phosphate phosphatase